MIVVQTRIRPTLSKLGEVRSLIEETIQKGTVGGRVALSRTVFGELPVFIVSALHDDLAAYESSRDANFANPDYMSAVGTLSTLIREPVESNVSEILTPVPAVASVDVRYTHHADFHPALGKAPEARAILEKWVVGQRSAGRSNAGMTRRMFPTAGPVFTTRDTYSSLSEYESVAQQRAENVAALVTNLTPCLQSPGASMELREIIVPMS